MRFNHKSLDDCLYGISKKADPRFFIAALLPLIIIGVIGLDREFRRSAAFAQGNTVTVTSAASYEKLLAPSSIAAAFGGRLATPGASDVARSQPLPTTLAGTTVRVNGVLAQLFSVAQLQVNFVVPNETAPGTATVTVQTGDGVISTGTFEVRNVAPAIFTANASGKGVPSAVLLRLSANGDRSFEPIDRPILFNREDDRLFLLLYLSGVRRAAPGTVKALIAGNELPTDFAAASGFTGLDQVNVELPLYLRGRGRLNSQIKAPESLSNLVEIEMGGPDVRVATTTTVTSSANPAVAGQEVVFTARVSAAGAARIPSGNVMLTENGVMIGKKPLDNAGQVSFTQVFTTTGGRNLAASYEGDNFFKESNGALSGQQNINKARATITLTSSANPSNLAQAVTLTAELRPISPSTITPTGIVQFKKSDAPIGTPITLVNGRAGFSISTLALGASNITADYYGDPSFQPAASATFTQTVNTAPLQITGIIRPTPVYAGEEITINGSGFTANPTDHEVKVVADNGIETTGKVAAAAADQLRVRVPFDAGSGKVKVVVGGREMESADRILIGTSVSGFVQEFKEGARVPVVGLPVSLSATVSALTNEDGSFVLKPAPVSSGLVITIGGRAANGRDYPAQTRKMPVSGGRDNQYVGDTDQSGNRLANIIEVKSNGSTFTGALADNTAVNETLSVAAPASPAEIAEQITNGQVIFDTNNSTITFPPGGNRLTLTVLDPGRTPANLPVGRFSSTIAQITPFTATLTPGGKLTFPNSDAIPTGTPVRTFRFDQTTNSQTLGQFIDIGAATISADGTKIETAANAVTQTSYYFVSRQWPTATIVGKVLDGDGRVLRRAVVNARGQSVFTDNFGGFVLSNVPVITPDGVNDQVTIEISFVRPDGSVARTQRTITGLKAGETRQVNEDFVLPRAATNRAPQILAPSSLVVNEGETRNFNFIVNDPDGNPVSVAVSGAPFASLTGSGNPYTLRLAPGANSADQFTLTIVATDTPAGGPRLSGVQPVAVTVRRADTNAPTANYLATTTNEDTPVNFTLSASNPGGGLVYTFASLPAHGSLRGTAPNFSYTPDPDFNGFDSLSFKVSGNGGESNVATVFIAVKPVNDAPRLTVLPATLLNVSAGEIVTNAGEIVRLDLTATDPDAGQTLMFNARGLPPGASLIPAGDTAQFTWTSIFAQAGTYPLTFTVTDDGSPPMMSEARTVTITCGAKWSRTSGPEGGTISALFAAGNKRVFAGTTGGGAYLSTNGGQSWAPANSGITDPYPTAFATVGNNVFAATHYGGVFRTSNDGQTWDAAGAGLLLTSQAVRIETLFTSGTTLWASRDGFEDDSKHGVFVSTNQGQSWQSADGGIPAATLTYAFAQRDQTLFAVTSAGVYTRAVSGQTWTSFNNGFPANTEVFSLAVTATGAVMAGTNRGAYFLFELAGNQQWVASNNGLPTPAPGIGRMIVRGEVFFAGAGNRLYVRPGLGSNWRPADSGLPANSDFGPLTTDGQTVLVGTRTAGIYRSVDDGNSWSAVNSGVVAAGVTSMAVIGKTLVASTGGAYPGASSADGVIRSSDQGQTWTASNITSPPTTARILGVSGASLFAWAAGAGVHRSDDQGKTWSAAGNGLPTYVSGSGTLPTFISAFVASGSSLFVSSAPGVNFPGTASSGAGGVWRSVNNGQNWASSGSGLPAGVSVFSLGVSGTTLLAGTVKNGVYRSTDNGQNWTPANAGIAPTAPGGQTYYPVTAIGVSGTTFFAATGANSTGPYSPFGFLGGAIYRSTDQGQTWTPVNSGINILIFVYKFLASGANIFAATNFGLYVNTSQGQRWTRVATGFSDDFSTSLVLSDSELFAGTSSASVIRLTNSVQSWTEAGNGLASRLINVTATKGSDIFAGTLGGGLFRSTDQGQSWRAANGSSPSGLPPNANVQALTASGNNLFAGLFGNGIYRSANDGASWTISGLANQSINVLTASTNGVIFAGTDAGVFRSNDQGLSWQAAGLGNQRVMSFAFSGNKLFAGTAGGGIYVSPDNGSTWTLTGSSANGLGNSNVTALSVGADGATLFAGTDGGGIYRSTNGGGNWAAVNNDLPPTLNVYSFAVSGAKLYAGSIYGVFLSEDNGAKWKQLNAGLLDIYTTSLAVSGKTLIAGTRVGGVFTSQIP